MLQIKTTLALHGVVNKYYLYRSTGYPRICFSKIACWITVFITIQRCLCMAFPLSIKTTLTQPRTALVVVSIFVVAYFTTVFPISCTGAVWFGWKFYSHRNRTLLGLIYGPNFSATERIESVITTVSQLVSFAACVVPTIILVVQLNQRSKWLGKSAGNYEAFSRRDSRIGIMVSLLSFILIVCYFPSTLCVIFYVSIPGFHFGGWQENFFKLFWAAATLLESANSSVTFFVYLKMSSKYRSMFSKVLCQFTRGSH